MNINYILNMTSDNEYINSYLEEIKSINNRMKENSVIHLTDTSINVNETHIQLNKNTCIIDDLLNEQNKHIQDLLLLTNKLSQCLIKMCDHEWFTDSIDIDLDRSKTIEYCKICGTTK